MTLEIDSPSIFEDLKNVIGLMRGVKIIGVTDNMGLEIPNETTLSAMKEAESGEDAGIVNIDSVENFIASMRWWKKYEKPLSSKKTSNVSGKDKNKVEALLNIVRMLAEGKVLPKENKPHPLGGDYKNHMECHIGDDYLLIWFDREKDIIKLVRLGSHSELFGNNKKR